MLLFPLKNALRYSEPPSAIIAAVATATRQKQAAEMPEKRNSDTTCFCAAFRQVRRKYIFIYVAECSKSGNALCSFMIILLSECIHLYPKDIFGVWFVCGLK